VPLPVLDGGGAFDRHLSDVLTRYFGSGIAYRLIPAWNLLFTGLATVFLFKLYKSWKNHGGDEAYMPTGVECIVVDMTVKPAISE
jgi:hypothetical protein